MIMVKSYKFVKINFNNLISGFFNFDIYSKAIINNQLFDRKVKGPSWWNW